MEIPTDLQEHISECIKELVEEKFDGNKTKFGKTLGVDNSQVNIILSGRRSRWSVKQLYILFNLHEVDLNQLFGLKEAPEAPEAAQTDINTERTINALNKVIAIQEKLIKEYEQQLDIL